MSGTGEQDEIPRAEVHPRRPFQIVWLIPLVAIVIAAFLGWRAVVERGPTITLTFNSGDGLQAGQTKVKHKAVDLGTVQSINLSRNMAHVVVRVDMRREAASSLTENARFWVVKPRLNAGNVSGLETLLSGSYIEIDPGPPGAPARREFTGLEEPPAVRSDEPGSTFQLRAERLGSLASGSPVFFRDIVVGEVLGYSLRQQGGGVNLQAFIRSPYDRFVHESTHFWNASGISFQLGANGVQVQLESLQAALLGGIAFDTTHEEENTPVSKPNTEFTLYTDEERANSAGYATRIPFLTYIEGSVRGLAVGAPVELFGIQIGNVTDIRLEFDPLGGTTRVAVRFEVQPGRMPNMHKDAQSPPMFVARSLVQRGLRVQSRTASFITGQMVLAMEFFPNAPPTDVSMQGDAIVWPNMPGGLDSVTSSLSLVAQKLQRLPLDEIAANLNSALMGVSGFTSGPELKRSLAALADAMTSTRDLVRKLDTG
jgi:paraquat-inducible protein B